MEIHCLYQDPLEISSSTPLVRARVTQRLEHYDYYRFLQTVYISLVVYKEILRRILDIIVEEIE